MHITNQNKYSLSVVIPTLGGNSLNKTLESINRGSIVPDEILVCIPENEVVMIQDLSFHNLRVLVTPIRGQVGQRAIGFQAALYEIVMQLDDDLIIDEYCIENLLKTLNSCGPKVAVAPALINKLTGKSAYKTVDINTVIKRIFYWVMNGKNGFQPGKIAKSGLNFGFDTDGKSEKVYEVDWLAGGCVMHYSKNLILENFYPFKGKAYCEDIIHSYLLREKNISLYIDSSACCEVELFNLGNLKHNDYVKFIIDDYRARKYAMMKFSRYSIRIIFLYISYYTHFILSNLIKKLS